MHLNIVTKVIASLLCLISSGLLGQQNIKFKNQIKISEQIFGNLGHSPIYSDNRYLYLFENVSSLYYLKIFEVRSEKITKHSVSIPDSIKIEIRRKGIFGMAADSSKIILLLDNKTCYVFEMTKSQFVFKGNYFKLNSLPQQILLYKKELICCYNYFFHPRDNSRWFYIERYDIITHANNIIHESKENYPFLLIYSPKRLFSLRENTLIFSSKAERKIYNLNLNNLSLDSISILGNWTYLNDSINQLLTLFFHTDFFEGFANLDDIVSYKISMCKNLGFYRDSWAALNYCQPVNSDCRLNTNWDLVNIYTGKFITVKEINCDKIDVHRKRTAQDIDIFSANAGLITFSDGYILKLLYDAPINPVGKSYSEYYKLRKRYLRRKRPVLLLQKYEVS